MKFFPDSPGKLPSILPAALLVALAWLAFANSFPGSFILDDRNIVLNNPIVERFDVKEILFSDYWGASTNSGNYRPLTIFSLALDRAVFGTQAWWFHLVNVALHSLVGVLLWVCLSGLWGEALFSWLAAALFAVHPIHTEVVNEAVGRGELLAALFMLAGLVAGKREGWRSGALTGLFFLLALLSKEHSVAFLALLPLADHFRGGLKLRVRLPLYLGMAGVFCAWLLLRHYALAPRASLNSADSPLMAPLGYMEPLPGFLTALRLQWSYVAKLLWPTHLQGIYSGADFPPVVASLASPSALAVALASLLVVAAAVWGIWRREPAGFFLGMYLVAFAPVSNIFFKIAVSFAERLAYSPSLWFCALVAALAKRAAEKVGLRAAVAAVACFMVLLGIFSFERNKAFADEKTLFQTDIGNDPGNTLAWVLISFGAQPGERDEIYRQMLEAAPKDFGGAPLEYALYLARSDRRGEALAPAHLAEELWRKAGDPRSAYAGALIAQLYCDAGRWNDALWWIERGARFRGDEDRIHELRGESLAALGRHEEAVAAYSSIERWLPGSNASYRYGKSLLAIGRVEEARKALERAGNLAPSGGVWNALGIARAEGGDMAGAVEAFKKALEFDRSSAVYNENLSRALSGAFQPGRRRK